jgi:hypothetical protein
LKRVNYTFGLVLGVEEFVQSDTYFLAKHHTENRLLHGYGTVCGLSVVTQTAPVLEVQVTPGWAVNPRGQEIKVPQLMCLQVDSWLATNLAALQSAVAQSVPPATLNLCVVLCYRECKTDVVPIPGEPCRTQSSSMAPSRIADSFDLMLCLDQTTSPPLSSPPGSSAASGLCLTAPAQLEDDSVRALAALLAEFQISSSGPYLTLDQVEQLILNLNQPPSSPPAGPPYLVSAADAADYRRAAIRTWITQVRPFICAAQGAGPCCPPPEKCVLLAELVVDLTGGATEWLATSVSVDDSRRPLLIPGTLMQELILGEAAALSTATEYMPVAAAQFSSSGALVGPSLGNLTASLSSPPDNEFLLSFPSYQDPQDVAGLTYIVKGTVQSAPAPNTDAMTLELVDFETAGIRIALRSQAAGPLQFAGFMVEIAQIGGGL